MLFKASRSIPGKYFIDQYLSLYIDQEMEVTEAIEVTGVTEERDKVSGEEVTIPKQTVLRLGDEMTLCPHLHRATSVEEATQCADKKTGIKQVLRQTPHQTGAESPLVSQMTEEETLDVTLAEWVMTENQVAAVTLAEWVTTENQMSAASLVEWKQILHQVGGVRHLRMQLDVRLDPCPVGNTGIQAGHRMSRKEV